MQMICEFQVGDTVYKWLFNQSRGTLLDGTFQRTKVVGRVETVVVRCALLGVPEKLSCLLVSELYQISGIKSSDNFGLMKGTNGSQEAGICGNFI